MSGIGHNSGNMDAYLELMREGKPDTSTERVHKAREKMKESGVSHVQTTVLEMHRADIHMLGEILRNPEHPHYSRLVRKLEIIRLEWLR